VLLTRPSGRGDAWQTPLEAAGAVVLSHPTIAVEPPESWAPLDEALARLDGYAWVVFTSAAAVEFCASRWPASHPPQGLGRPRIAAVGPATAAALSARGFSVAMVPEDQRQEGLLAGLSVLPPGTAVLFPQAVGGRSTLAGALGKRGIVVDVVPASRTVARRNLPSPPPFDVVVFASPSAFEAFRSNHGTALLEGRVTIAIGPTTASALSAAGVVATVAGGPTVDGVIAAIAAHWPGLPSTSGPAESR